MLNLLMQLGQCVLCCEEVRVCCNFMCGHGPVCHLCGLKVDKQFNDVKCPICKQVSPKVWFGKSILAHDKIDWKKACFSERFRKYFYYETQAIMQEVISYEEFRCPISNCRDHSVLFDNYNRLKRHLHEVHHKTFCEVCVQNSSLTLRQQRLYSEHQYQEHLHCGQQLQNGQELYHPYCKFCNKNFYDQDKVQAHLRQAHERCNLCPPQFKTVYYKNYESLERHFQISHFMCPNEICRAERYKAYFTKEELQDHFHIYHGEGKSKHRNLDQLLGFNRVHQNFRIKDHEGIDFKPQFVSMRHHIFQNLQENISHQDEQIDFRDFYPNALKNVKMDNLTFMDRLKAALKESKDPTLEQVDVFIPLAMTPLKMNDFYRLLKEALSSALVEKLHSFIGKHHTITDASKFCRLLDRQFDNQATCLYVLPLLIRCWQNQSQQIQLDRQYLRMLLQLHRSKPLHLIKQRTHGEFLKEMHSSLREAMKERLQKKQLSLREYVQKGVKSNYGKTFGEGEFAVQRQKIVQILHVISHIPTKEMIKFRWLFKLGLSLSAYEQIMASEYDPPRFRDICLKLAPKHLALLYIYLRMCVLAIFNKIQFAVEKDQKNVNFLASFLAENKPLLALHSLSPAVLSLGKQHFVLQKKDNRDLFQQQFPTLKAQGIPPTKKAQKKPPDQPRAKLKPRDDQQFPALEEVPLPKKKKTEINFVKVKSGDYQSQPVQPRPQTSKPRQIIQDDFPTLQEMALEQAKQRPRQQPKNKDGKRDQRREQEQRQAAESARREEERRSEFDPSMFIEKKKPLDPELQFGHRKKKKYSYKP